MGTDGPRRDAKLSRSSATIDTLTDAIELVMDEFGGWRTDEGILAMRHGPAETAALMKLREAYEAVVGSQSGEAS